MARRAARVDANQREIVEALTTITLPGERAPSWNTLYRQGHWSKRKRLVDEIKWRMREAIDPDAVTVATEPVRLHITAAYKSRPVDCDNVCSKPYIDALRGWLIADDDTRSVVSVTLESVKAQSDSVTIGIYAQEGT